MGALFDAWWKSNGFSTVPTYHEADGTGLLFRVYGGHTSKPSGSFYSLSDPEAVSAAESNSNIVKWGNLCLYVATFRARKGTPMYAGRGDQCYERKDIDSGEDVFVGGSFDAKQVWIDKRRAL